MIKYYTILEPAQAADLPESLAQAVIIKVDKRIRPTGLVAVDVQDDLFETRSFVLIKNEHNAEQLQALEAIGAVSMEEQQYLEWLHDRMGYSHLPGNPNAVREVVQLADGTAATVESMGFRTDYAAKTIHMDVRITYADGSRREEYLIASNKVLISVSESASMGEYDYITSQIDSGLHPDQIQRNTILHRGSAAGGRRFEKK